VASSPSVWSEVDPLSAGDSTLVDDRRPETSLQAAPRNGSPPTAFDHGQSRLPTIQQLAPLADHGAPVSERVAAELRLREIQSIMDTALHRLDVDALLTVLLDRVLGILSSDTAAVLLLDDDSRQLVARAARGVEEEVRQGVRIPVGVGFAGRIAAERRPVTLDRVDATTVTNPILWEKGIQAMLGVPLVAGGQLLGVLHVGSFTDRRFGPRDVELLEIVADRVASAVQTTMLAAERTTAKVLQRSLLPTALPYSPALRLASRYLPAEYGGIGGDWYDAFSLPSGDFWVMAGDVCGHGLRPAVIMGRLRSTLRAYAFEGWPPDKVLHFADLKLQHFEEGVTATVACAVFSPPFDHFQLALAGHPPPVLAAEGQATRLLDVPRAPLLGATTRAGPRATRIEIPSRGVLVLYTDGLVERRAEPLEQGFERLRLAVTPDDPELVCRQVTDALIGDWSPQDDVALIALQRR
jgi:putative methionine-R-sulfoxide reductase with GAF domain